MDRRWLAIGAVNGLFSVALGALAAHGLRGRLDPEVLSSFEVGVRYQMVHALALLAVAGIVSKWPSRVATACGLCMLTGIVLFSGSIYALSLTEWKWVWPLTPAGGALFLIGWLLMAIAPFVGSHQLLATRRRE